MGQPGVNILLTNGGLNLQAPTAFSDSVALLACEAAPVAGYGVAFLVKSKKQIQTAFGEGNDDAVTALSAFYNEAPEGTKLYVLAMAQTTTLATLLATANASKPLLLAAGTIRLMAAIKFPDPEVYTPTITDGFDADVHAAATAAQTLATEWLGYKRPFRILLEGYGFTTAGAAKTYAADTKPNVGIVIGKVADSTALATMYCLGRAARVLAQQNIGRIKTGSLKIPDTLSVKIGATLAEQMALVDLDTLHEKRYITFVKNATAPGFVFNDDLMLTEPTNDYGNLRHGRVIDNAVRVAFATYYQELKDDVDVDDNGRLYPVDEKAIEGAIEQAVEATMGGQLSRNDDGSAAVECIVNPDTELFPNLYEDAGISNPNFNLLSGGTIYLYVRCRPKACLSYINVLLGFDAAAS